MLYSLLVIFTFAADLTDFRSAKSKYCCICVADSLYVDDAGVGGQKSQASTSTASASDVQNKSSVTLQQQMEISVQSSLSQMFVPDCDDASRVQKTQLATINSEIEIL